MNEFPSAGRPNGEVVTEAGNTVVLYLDGADPATGSTWTGRQPISNPHRLRSLVRDRLRRGESPLPDGFPLPPGVTLEDLLGPPPQPGR